MACYAGAGGEWLDWTRTPGLQVFDGLGVSSRAASTWLFLDRKIRVKARCRHDQNARVGR